jgi:flagellar hook-associated protein 3 FlgL
MQISTSYLFDRASAQMGTLQSDLAKSQAQIASHKQVLNPSDAPDQAAAIARLKSVIGRQDSYGKAIDAVQARLQTEDSTLKSASDVLVRIKELGVQANNSTLSSSNRQALGTELKGLRDQLLSLANSRDVNGNFIFSGSRVSQAAFAANSTGQVIYNGDQTQMNVAVGEQRSVAMNRPGSNAFVRVVRSDGGTDTGISFFQSLDDMIAAVNSSNSAGMQRSLGETDSLLQGVLLAQANVGTSLKVLEQQGNVLQDTTLTLKSALSNLEDLDYASAIAQMNKQMLSLEAAQSSFAKISQLSLFNYLR